MRASDLSEDGWALTSPEALKLLQKLQGTGVPLGKYVNREFYRGVVTGYNDAFLICESVCQQLIAEDARSSELIKPVLKGRDLKKWRTDCTSHYLIFAHHGIDIEQYPAIKRHLNQYRADLEPKKSREQKRGRKMGNYKWYEVQDTTAYHEEFEEPKIIYPETAKSLYACYDTAKVFGLKTTYFIPTSDLSLLAILNSSLFDWYARHKFYSLNDPWAGGRLSFKKESMQNVPIAAQAAAQKAALSCLAEQILVDPEDNEVRNLQQEIDAQVYQLYKLKDEEIALIERTYEEAGMQT